MEWPAAVTIFELLLGLGASYVPVNNRPRYTALIATLLLVFSLSLHAQETCDAEVKLLLSPTQVAAAVAALQAGRESHGRVYFYDTPALDLLSKGVILRLREGAESDLTTKFRPLSGERLVDPSGGRERYKCEVDVISGVENQSYSLENKYGSAETPETGEALFRLLSEGQKQLLKDTKAQIDWKRVKRIAEIRSTSWTTHANRPLGKLSLELWEWPNGSILEVSTKVTADAGQATYVELQELAKKDGLALNKNQQAKTTIVLEEITGSH
jgi:hypothetical protein